MIDKPVLIISGPTASNKTFTSINLAKEIFLKLKKESVIVNFDSLLFYQELSIGTAKPSREELSQVPHEMVNIASIKNPLNAAGYVEMAAPLVNGHLNGGKAVILAGGSSFYIRALIKGMYDSPTIPPEVQDKIDKTYEKEGIEYFLSYLRDNDGESFNQLHSNDHYRIIRAAGHHMVTGEKFSKQKARLDENLPYDFSKNEHPDWNILHIYLDIPKPEHQKIIEARASKMIEEGLIEEVKTLLASGFTGQEKPMNSVGYKEVQAYLRGELGSLDEMKERIVISTRQLAKAQRTFFKKVVPKNQYHGVNDQKKILKDVVDFFTQA